MRSGTASLFKKHFPPGNEVGLDTLGIVPDGEELKPIVVFDAEIVSECGDERLAFRIVVVETEAEHQGRGLHHVGVDVQFVASRKDDLQVVLVHERKIAGRDADKSLVVFYDVMGSEEWRVESGKLGVGSGKL